MVLRPPETLVGKIKDKLPNWFRAKIGEQKRESVLLDPNLFRRNHEAGSRAKRKVVLNKGIPGKEMEIERLVDLDETVVSFTGTGDQAVSFIMQAQEQPLSQVDDTEIVRNWNKLKRTGIQVLTHYNNSLPYYQEDILNPNIDPTEIDQRLEIIGLERNEYGSFTITYLCPNESDIAGFTSPKDLEAYGDDYDKKLEEWHQRRYYDRDSTKKEVESPMNRYLDELKNGHHLDEFQRLINAMFRGAIIIANHQGPFLNFIFKNVRLGLNNRINYGNDRHEVVKEAALLKIMSKLVVPSAAASKLDH